MTGKLFQPVLFNLITIVAMLFLLFQLVESVYRTGVVDIIESYAALVEEGAIEDEGLRARLEAEKKLLLQLGTYILSTLMIAILANVAANYMGRGRHFENTARIRELEAEIRGLRGR